MANWYRFTAHNSPRLYGYSDRHDRDAIAAAQLELLNKGREINLYAVEVLPGDAADTDSDIERADYHGDVVFSSDTALDDIGRGE